MKKLLCIPFLMMFMLACEEIVLVPEYHYDTLYLPDPCGCVKYDTIVLDHIDTVEVKTVIVDHDTLLQVRTDSIFVTKTVTITQYDTVYLYLHDTIAVHHYGDTLVKFESERDLEVLGEWKDVVIEFYRETAKRGRTESAGGNLIIEIWPLEDFPPDNRSAFTYYVYGQRLIKIKESLTVDQSYGPIFRELAREIMGARYSNDPNSLMNPAFDPNRLRLSSPQEEKDKYLDELFATNPI